MVIMLPYELLMKGGDVDRSPYQAEKNLESQGDVNCHHVRMNLCDDSARGSYQCAARLAQKILEPKRNLSLYFQFVVVIDLALERRARNQFGVNSRGRVGETIVQNGDSMSKASVKMTT